MSNTAETDWRELLTATERAWTLNDIARVSLAVGCRLFPEQPWNDLDVTANSLTTHKCPIERLGFIERALPPLTQAAEQIQHYPPLATVTATRPISPPSRARRVGTAALLSAVRRGHAGRFLEETVALPSADTPENRAVKSFLQILGRDAVAIASIAEAGGESEAASRAAQCAGRLQDILKANWWQEIVSDPVAWLNPPVSRMQGQAAYAQILFWMMRYRQGFSFNWNAPLFRLPPRETWRLYEAWCLFIVLAALMEVGWSATESAPELIRVQEGRLTCTLASGHASRLLLTGPAGQRLAVYYNRAYPEGASSRSHTMLPDITLTRPDTQQIWLLDAKFKTYALPGEEGADINQMHAYRDGIVGLDGMPTVARAWCLYAGQVDGFNRPTIAYGDTAASLVGALCLRPGNPEGFSRLCQLLCMWLN